MSRALIATATGLLIDLEGVVVVNHLKQSYVKIEGAGEMKDGKGCKF